MVVATNEKDKQRKILNGAHKMLSLLITDPICIMRLTWLTKD